MATMALQADIVTPASSACSVHCLQSVPLVQQSSSAANTQYYTHYFEIPVKGALGDVAPSVSCPSIMPKSTNSHSDRSLSGLSALIEGSNQRNQHGHHRTDMLGHDYTLRNVDSERVPPMHTQRGTSAIIEAAQTIKHGNDKTTAKVPIMSSPSAKETVTYDQTAVGAKATPSTAKVSPKHRLIFVRNAERVDRVFPDWLNRCFANPQMYMPDDLNLPQVVPERLNGPSDFRNDSPITELGYVQAQMLGRGLRRCNMKPALVLSAPALRCVQTANAIIAGMLSTTDDKWPDLQIAIEPALCEYLGWYNKFPAFVSPEAYEAAGFPIDITYKPRLSMCELSMLVGETMESFYGRMRLLVEQIQTHYKGMVDGDIVIVTHATIVDACYRMLMNVASGYASNENELELKGAAFPYCSVIGLEGTANGSWKLSADRMPVISSVAWSSKVQPDFSPQSNET